MEYGGITPIGLPDGWPILVDEATVAAASGSSSAAASAAARSCCPARRWPSLPSAEVLALTQAGSPVG